jgi:hypothetical protein
LPFSIHSILGAVDRRRYTHSSHSPIIRPTLCFRGCHTDTLAAPAGGNNLVYHDVVSASRPRHGRRPHNASPHVAAVPVAPVPVITSGRKRTTRPAALPARTIHAACALRHHASFRRRLPRRDGCRHRRLQRRDEDTHTLRTYSSSTLHPAYQPGHAAAETMEQ